ncbi:cupin domain-containing protein [Chloroflexota bacterium]
MVSKYYWVPNLVSETTHIPKDSIVSRTLYSDDRVKVILFTFAAGQELSDHTSTSTAILHFICGNAKLKIAEDELDSKDQAWLYLPSNMPHSIYAITEVTMLLYLITEKNFEKGHH